MSKKYPGPNDFVPREQDHPLMSGIKGRKFINQLPIRDAASFREVTHRIEPIVRYDMHKYRRVDGIVSVIFPELIEEDGATYVANCMADLGQFGVFVEKNWKRILRPEDLPDYARLDMQRMVKAELSSSYADSILSRIKMDIEYICYRFYDDDYFTNCGYDPYGTHGVMMSS